MKVLITGICGFIGHHVAEHILVNTDWDIVGIDRLSYASNGFNRLRDAIGHPNDRVSLFSADFTQPFSCGLIKEIGQVDYILHLGAETHVDNSIKNPESFVFSNVVGTMRVLDFARIQDRLRRFVYFSTDEVFGPAPAGTSYKEWDRYNSTNPYSATKAGGEELCLAYSNTYKIPLVVTHTMNAFGERQHPEKFIPLIINKVLKGEEVTIHSDRTKTKAGSRFYIHCRNIASAILFILDKRSDNISSSGMYYRDKFNIVGEREVNNLDMAQFIARTLGKELKYEMVDFHSSRPGHDLRYALDGSKLEELGWHIPKTFEDSLVKTIQWYVNNPKWLDW
jgi:dTDP-glucose 4,6-dehydratase